MDLLDFDQGGRDDIAFSGTSEMIEEKLKISRIELEIRVLSVLAHVVC